MKLQTALFTAILLAGCTQQPGNAGPAQAPGAASMADPQPAPTPGDQATTGASTMGIKASGMGTVQTVDGTAGKVTIAHGPIAPVHWPAMTMTFKASPEQLASVKAGQKV